MLSVCILASFLTTQKIGERLKSIQHEKCKKLSTELRSGVLKMQILAVEDCSDISSLPDRLIRDLLWVLTSSRESSLRLKVAALLSKPKGNARLVVKPLVQQLRNEPHLPVRRQILWAIASYGSEAISCTGALIDIIKNKDAYDNGPYISVPLLMEVPGDLCEAALASHALTGIGEPSVKQLVEIFCSTNSNRQAQETAGDTLLALSHFTRNYLVRIRQMIDSDNSTIRLRALQILVRAEKPLSYATRRTLSACLEDRDSEVQIWAALNLAMDSTLNVTALPLLLQISTNIELDNNVRISAINALVQLGPLALSGRKRITTLFQDPDAVIRRSAVFAVGRMSIGAKDCLKDILPLLDDKDPGVRGAAKSAISELKGEK